MTKLSTRYSHKETEEKWSRFWEEQNLFHGEANSQKQPFTITIPPPNVTGILHMGHALNNTLQDIIIRYKRMQGFEACWMPGTDHAGIATQNVVEKQLAKEGKDRHQVGREDVLKRLWDWKEQYGDTIIHQLKKLGASCDWVRTRFTMDEHYSEAVKEVFIRLYEKGLVYQGEYIIHWCPRCHTALSDEEAEHQELQGALYHIRYPLKNNPKEYLVVATTRPETMLGDTAVAVHPNDERYQNFIGQTLTLPIINREITVIPDEFVSPEFGTGAVKVTPAHDPNDFEMGRRHNLEFVNIMHPDATLNNLAGDFAGQDRFEAREAIIETLRELKLLEKIEPHTHAVGHCYRCHTVVEPYLSKQWFVKMEPLAKPAIEAVKDGRIKFYPERWSKVYLNWMDNIRDWCISRQIWWGHRIPVWYDDHGNIFVAPDEESAKKQAQDKHGREVPLKQDEDVLDTWFSSWLWPFATFGWPSLNEELKIKSEKFNEKDLNYFYPGNALFTASEIIFFWVARMIMAGFEFMDEIPFSDVYIHGTVRDSQGRKMSKSLGNAIDPLEIIEEYGADALRFSLILNSGQDLFISKEKFEIGRNFANKLWNASRLILMNTNGRKASQEEFLKLNFKNLDLPSRWITSQFFTTLTKINTAIEHYRFSEAESLIYDFFWGDFCDWYLEMIKDRFQEEDTQIIAINILEQTLRMMHPFLPFVTEEIWQKIKNTGASIVTEPWPEIQKQLISQEAEDQMQQTIELITSIRNVRTQWNISSKETIDCSCITKTSKEENILKSNDALIKKLARIRGLRINEEKSPSENSAVGVVGSIKFHLPLGELIDIQKEKNRILEQIKEQEKNSQNIANRLKNKDFIQRAPKDVVDKDRLRLESMEAKIRELKEVIQNFN